jgi:hypothetical protein
MYQQKATPKIVKKRARAIVPAGSMVCCFVVICVEFEANKGFFDRFGGGQRIRSRCGPFAWWFDSWFVG